MFVHALIVLLVSLCASVTAAQSNGNGAINEARVHFERGVELYREGSLDAALAEFERSYQIAPNYKLLYNLAQVQAERHEYVLAVKLFNDYVQAGMNEITPERKRAVGEDVDKLRERIASLTIDVSVDGADVYVNDALVGRSPLPNAVLVNVGNCRVRAEKTGFAAKQQTLTVAGADRPHVKLELVANPALVQRAAPSTVTVQKADMTPFWISVGATVALGGATAVFGALALNANSDLDRELNQLPAQRERVDAARRQLRTMAALTDGFGAASIVAAGSAIYFLLAPPEHTEVMPAARVHARLTPAGVSLSGVF